MSLFLQNYGLEKSGTQFVVNFSIPDNCEYVVTLSSNVNLITVTLKPGEKDPSSKFDNHQENFSAINDVLLVDFELNPDDLTSAGIKKPRLRVDDLFQM